MNTFSPAQQRLYSMIMAATRFGGAATSITEKWYIEAAQGLSDPEIRAVMRKILEDQITEVMRCAALGVDPQKTVDA